MAKSKRQKAFEMFKFSDPEWKAAVIPVAGASGDFSVVASRVDTYTNRTMYGQVLATYHSKTIAERLSKELNETKAKILATAYP